MKDIYERPEVQWQKQKICTNEMKDLFQQAEGSIAKPESDIQVRIRPPPKRTAAILSNSKVSDDNSQLLIRKASTTSFSRRTNVQHLPFQISFHAVSNNPQVGHPHRTDLVQLRVIR